MSDEAILAEESDRSRSRARHRGPFTAELRKEAPAPVMPGRLDDPRKLNTYGRFVDSPKYQLDVAFRITVNLAGKIRARDDLKHPHTNRGMRASSPITLPTWGIIAQQCYIIADTPRDWGLGVNDHGSAYNLHPLGPDHADLAVAALRSPDGGKL